MTTTAPDGSYLFTNVAAGTYDVVVSGSNFGTGQPLEGYGQTGDPDQPGVPCTICNNTDFAVTVIAGDISLSSDFGYQRNHLHIVLQKPRCSHVNRQFLFIEREILKTQRL